LDDRNGPEKIVGPPARRPKTPAPRRLSRLACGSVPLEVDHPPRLEVEHQGFDDLARPLAAMRERALAIRAEGPVKPASMLRD